MCLLNYTCESVFLGGLIQPNFLEVSVIVLTMGCVRRGKQQLHESPQLHLCAVVGGPQRSFLGQGSA